MPIREKSIAPMQSLGGQFASPSGKAPAAGWVKALAYSAGAGLVGHIKWLANTAAMIQDGAYRYLSPTLLIDRNDRTPVALHSVALTNTPAIPGMPALAEFSESQASGVGAMTKTAFQQGQDAAAVATAEQKMGELKALLESKGAKLGDGADFVSILNAAMAIIKGEQRDDDTEGEGEAVAASELAGLRNGLTHAMRRVQELEGNSAVHSTEALVDRYLNQGKLLETHSEQMVWARSMAAREPQAFAMMMDMAPVIIPQGRTTPPPAPFSQRNGSRQSAIMSAFSEWQRDSEELVKMTTCVAFVNLRLREADYDRLSDSEAKEYA